MFAEGLAAVDFTRQMGHRCQQTADTESLRIFGLARERCFQLLGVPVTPGETLGFTDYVSGRAMAGTS
ncbi:MAG: hypothetical protein ABIP94_15665 [Planctomycetota bacterium]